MPATACPALSPEASASPSPARRIPNVGEVMYLHKPTGQLLPAGMRQPGAPAGATHVLSSIPATVEEVVPVEEPELYCVKVRHFRPQIFERACLCQTNLLNGGDDRLGTWCFLTPSGEPVRSPQSGARGESVRDILPKKAALGATNVGVFVRTKEGVQLRRGRVVATFEPHDSFLSIEVMTPQVQPIPYPHGPAAENLGFEPIGAPEPIAS